MRLAVLDTNVIVSAGINPEGAPAAILMDWVLEGQVHVVTCPCIVAEYRQVVRRKKFAAYGFPPLWLDFMVEESLSLPDPDPWPLILPDLKDGPFLALTHASGAWLVSGNLKHFPPNSRKSATVLSPADYLMHLRTGQPIR